MGKAENFDPPPPYTANDFDRVDPPPTAPQYGFVPGVAPQPGPSQMGVPPPQGNRHLFYRIRIQSKIWNYQKYFCIC